MDGTHALQAIDGKQRCEGATDDPSVSGYVLGAITLFISVAAAVALSTWWISGRIASRARRIVLGAGCALLLGLFGLSTYASTKAETNGHRAFCYAMVGCENTCREGGVSEKPCAEWCHCMISHVAAGEAKEGESQARAYGRFAFEKEPKLDPAAHAAIIRAAKQACPRPKRQPATP